MHILHEPMLNDYNNVNYRSRSFDVEVNIEVTAVSSGLNMYNQSNGQSVPEYGVIKLIISAYNCYLKISDFTITCTLKIYHVISNNQLKCIVNKCILLP